MHANSISEKPFFRKKPPDLGGAVCPLAGTACKSAGANMEKIGKRYEMLERIKGGKSQPVWGDSIKEATLVNHSEIFC